MASGGSFTGAANQSGQTRVLTTDGSGNIGTGFDPGAMQQAITGLGQAVTSSGAMAAALTAVPQIALNPQEPMRCGGGVGGYGSSYAVALGCATRLSQRHPDISINAAISLANPVDYFYGSTPSVAGRIGFSVPLGVKRAGSTASPPPQPGSAVAMDGATAELSQQVRQLQLQHLLLQRQLNERSPGSPGTGRL